MVRVRAVLITFSARIASGTDPGPIFAPSTNLNTLTMNAERYTGPDPAEESTSPFDAVFHGTMTFASATFETSSYKADDAYEEQCNRLFDTIRTLEEMGWEFRLTRAEITNI